MPKLSVYKPLCILGLEENMDLNYSILIGKPPPEQQPQPLAIRLESKTISIESKKRAREDKNLALIFLFFIRSFVVFCFNFIVVL